MSNEDNPSQSTKNNGKTKSYVNTSLANFIGGILGGAVSTTLFQPLDLIKTRFQVQTNRTHKASNVQTLFPSYKGTLHACSTVIKTEGFLALYKGLLPNVIGSSLSWGIYVFVYNEAKLSLERAQQSPLGPASHLLAAVEAGVVTTVLTNPIWVIKTRLQLQTHQHQGNYKGLRDAFKTIYSEEGFKGFYKGLVPGLFSVSHGAFQFMAYEELKKLMILNNSGKQDSLSSYHYLAAASISKIFATVLTYPFQVVKSRLQERPIHNQSKYSGVVDVTIKLWRYEGFRGFYNGLIPNLMKVTPTSAVTLAVCEIVIKFLST